MINSAQLSDTELKDISFRKLKINRMEIFLKIEDDVHYEIIDLNEPKRLAIEFSPIQTISVEPWYEIQDTDLLSVRVEKVQPDSAGISKELSVYHYHAFQTNYEHCRCPVWYNHANTGSQQEN